MKTLFNIIFLGLLFVVPTLQAQQAQKEKKGVFVRVLNFEGRKLAKGFIQSVNNEHIIIQKGKRSKTIRIAEVQQLRLKRSLGHKIAVGAVSGALITGAFAISLDSATGDEGSWIDGLAYTTIAFGALAGGATVGLFDGIFGKHVQVEINGDREKLNDFIELVKSKE